MGESDEADHLAPLDEFAARDVDAAQIGDRDLQPGHRFDGHSAHSGHRPGKGDPP